MSKRNLEVHIGCSLKADLAPVDGIFMVFLGIRLRTNPPSVSVVVDNKQFYL